MLPQDELHTACSIFLAVPVTPPLQAMQAASPDLSYPSICQSKAHSQLEGLSWLLAGPLPYTQHMQEHPHTITSMRHTPLKHPPCSVPSPPPHTGGLLSLHPIPLPLTHKDPLWCSQCAAAVAHVPHAHHVVVTATHYQVGVTITQVGLTHRQTAVAPWLSVTSHHDNGRRERNVQQDNLLQERHPVCYRRRRLSLAIPV